MVILEASAGVMAEDWQRLLPVVKQPLLLLNAPGSFGPPGIPPVLPRGLAMETVNAVAEGSYVEVPGNHMTMLFGAGAVRMVAAIKKFVGR